MKSQLLIWLAANSLSSGQSIQQTILGLAFVLAIFACVLLHEFGHAFAAWQYGILTPDITLLPIGGVEGKQVRGVLRRQELIKAVTDGNLNSPVASFMQSDCSQVSGNDPLRATFEIMQGNNCTALPVVNDGTLVGLLTQANIGEWLMIQSAMHAAVPAKQRGS